MQCKQCGKDYPSQYYFVTESVCNECFAQLEDAQQAEIRRGAESLNREAAGSRVIEGNALSCPVCGHGEFWKRKTLMNTPGMTLFGVEWANRQADNYVCDSCGYVMWFLHDSVTQ